MTEAVINNQLNTGNLKIHRRYIPSFDGKIPNIVAAKRICAAIAVHDWNRNQSIYELRCNDNMRISIRSERRETYNSLASAIFANCDYNPDSEYLFEVMCSVEELARLVNQLHIYDSGRKSYDPVLHALSDWEKAKLIIIDRDKDPETKQWKAMRIWITAAFFEEFGFTVLEVRKMLSDYGKWLVKNGVRESHKERYARHILRLTRANIANLDNKHSLKNLLKKIKRLIIGDEELKREKAHIEQALKEKAEQAQAAKPEATRPYYHAYVAWANKQPRFNVIKLENEVKREQPALTDEDFYRCLLERIDGS